MKFIYLILLFFPITALSGNTTITSFNKTKKLLEKQVYNNIIRETLYCEARFDSKKRITDYNGFASNKYKKRAKKIEWEHVVPAENFGRTFIEWREGHPDCITKKGKTFKGRNCASKMSMEYRYMQADMYNLYPAIGAVNGLRSNYRFTMLDNDSLKLGNCEIYIESKTKRVMPSSTAKGIVARVGLYFEQAYKRYNLSKAQKKLFIAWDKKYPVTIKECQRNELIESIQGNINSIMKERCDYFL